MSNYVIEHIPLNTGETITIEREIDERIEVVSSNPEREQSPEQELQFSNLSNWRSFESEQKIKTFDDYIFHFYIGAITISGLFMLFRIIQKNK
jgi:hypothetical protein